MNSRFEVTDPSVLLQAVAQDRETFEELSRLFLRIVPELLQRLEEEAAGGNAAGVAGRAHALKGCLYLVGAQRLAQQLEAIEREARRTGAVCDARELACVRSGLLLACDEVRAYAA